MVFFNDERASGEAVGTILALGTLFLFASLTLPALTLITDASAIAQQNQLEFTGQRIAGEIQTVDQLVRRSQSTGLIARRISLPTHIGNDQYTITTITTPAGDQYLVLQPINQNHAIRVLFTSETPVVNTTLTGGNIVIHRAPGRNAIQIIQAGTS